MLKYSYTIRRDEGDKIQEYFPSQIPTELDDVVYIEGPNSSGKSTLLNLIALGFFGLKLKSDELHPALRGKLENLLSSTHQDVQFEIEIDNKYLSTTLTSKKPDFKSKEFQVRKKIGNTEKLLSPEQFKKQFKLIYDIPDNPLERLPQLLNEVRNEQQTKGNQVTTLIYAVKEAINNVRNSKDPKLIDKLHLKLGSQNEASKKKKSDLTEKKNFFDEFQKFFLTKIYLEILEEHEECNNELRDLEKDRKTVEKKEKKLTKDQESILRRITENMRKANSFYAEASRYLKVYIPNSEKHHLGLWLGSTCEKEIYEPDVYQSIRLESEYFINYLQDMMNEDDEANLNRANFLRSLMQLLSEYRHMEITIPVLDKNIDEFIEILEEEIQKYDGIMKKKRSIDACIVLLQDLVQFIKETIQYIKKYKSLIKDHKETRDQIKEISEADKIDYLLERSKKLKQSKAYYLKELLKINIDETKIEQTRVLLKKDQEFDTYEAYREADLKDKSNSLNKDIINLKLEIANQEKGIRFTLDEIERIESREPHKYQNYLEKLDVALEVLQRLEKKLLVLFDGNIKKIINKKDQLIDLDEDEQKYADCISEFLAEKVRFIKHVEDSYMVKKVDVINREILTEDGKKIKFADLGTGQSQAAYLGGLLSMHENKKIIALFDEVAMMDTHSLEPIIKKLKQLYEDKKLLIGIIVQKADELNVKSLV